MKNSRLQSLYGTKIMSKCLQVSDGLWHNNNVKKFARFRTKLCQLKSNLFFQTKTRT